MTDTLIEPIVKYYPPQHKILNDVEVLSNTSPEAGKEKLVVQAGPKTQVVHLNSQEDTRIFQITYDGYPNKQDKMDSEQAYTARGLAGIQGFEDGSGQTDVFVDYHKPGNAVSLEYQAYLKSLGMNVQIFEIPEELYSTEKSVATVLQEMLNDPAYTAQSEVFRELIKDSAILPFNVTQNLGELANKLTLELWGDPTLSYKFGTKTGFRELTEKYHLVTPPGRVCSSWEDLIKTAQELYNPATTQIEGELGYTRIRVKFAESLGGMGAYFWDIENLLTYNEQIKKLNLTAQNEEETTQIQVDEKMSEEVAKFFSDWQKLGSPEFVVEANIEKSKSLGAHLEILPNGEHRIVNVWQQVIDPTDDATYIGAKPFYGTHESIEKINKYLNELAIALKKEGVKCGSFGPDLLLAPNGDILGIEINGRVPATFYAANMAQHANGGSMPEGWFACQFAFSDTRVDFSDLQKFLHERNLIVENAVEGATGVVPYNIGLLNWGKCSFVAIAPNQEEADQKMNEIKEILPVYFKKSDR